MSMAWWVLFIVAIIILLVFAVELIVSSHNSFEKELKELDERRQVIDEWADFLSTNSGHGRAAVTCVLQSGQNLEDALASVINASPPLEKVRDMHPDEYEDYLKEHFDGR